MLHLDLNAEKYDSPKRLTDLLNNIFVGWEKQYGREETEISLSSRFAGIIRRACESTGRQVVVLVDEYDKPLLQSLLDETSFHIAKFMRELRAGEIDTLPNVITKLFFI